MLAIIFVIVIIIAVAISVTFIVNSRLQTKTPLINKEELNSLTRKSESTVYFARLAENITPPTNKWFSGIALQEKPQTVFPTPLAFTPTNTGFSYGLTGVEASADSIIASNRQEVSLEITNAHHYLITRYDELSVDLTYYDEKDSGLLVVTIASGSPYIYIKSLNDEVSIVTQQQFAENNSVLVYDTQRAKYAMSGIYKSDNSLRMSDETASLYAGFNQSDIETLKTYALNRITKVDVQYERKDDKYVTTFNVSTSNNNSTLLGYLPHQAGGDDLMSFNTIYGTQRFIAGSHFSFTTAFIDSPDQLDIASLTSTERNELTTMLRQEINATTFNGIDTYFAGKELYRSAQLLKLARQLDEPQIAGTIQQKLRNEFRIWFSPSGSRAEKYFYYDTELKSIVGMQASFGSNDDNDHHFHYGYFIYAASILAQYDETFVEEYGDMVNLLVADIANNTPSNDLPLRRSFDPYFGHSWASGSSPFNDGNNQESSSEAINAWVGVSLWAQVTKNDLLHNEANWMLSQEVNAMQSYWLNSAKPQGADAYSHQIYSLNWGGKRDYATFFTAEPAAKLGILLIPLNPSMQSNALLQSSAISTRLQESGDGNSADVYNFQDYLLMYSALQDSTNILEKVRTFNETDIDGANSRSYMYAWAVSAR